MVRKIETITVADRLAHGDFEVDEVVALKSSCRTTVRGDISSGRLPVKKRGRKIVIPGPIVAKYEPGIGVVNS
jgi:hypothetical protein